ncbi:hypothetical protein [Paractinoplanes lichenicola]|uniref:YtxH domain-containing protein n=1 Tax=Paractinoplanes lichenicola TaxID=2802976 RepID=A0ABS1VFN7_9ACTN|nr:hypothetical protein [Actinoplanes lichenicola]MBL7253430.1 hypothetical protein [Actinoplanes lichenicola]
MKIVKLAAGFAVGYVLGSRAGREAYEKISANARQLREHPTVRQAQDKATAMLSSGAGAATTRIHQAASGSSDSSDSSSDFPASTPAATSVSAPAGVPATRTVKKSPVPKPPAVAAPVESSGSQPLI